MAKSSLDLRGAKGSKLELDFLRLVYAVQTLRRTQHQAQGYLLVLSPTLVQRVSAWTRKYEARDAVQTLCPEIDAEDALRLSAEKDANVAGMLAGVQGTVVGDRSRATIGQMLGEAALLEMVKVAEPRLECITDIQEMPFGIRWDLYGVVRP